MLRTVVVATSLVGLATAECPNGCSSHGKCTAYDMCLCYRNWMANDCSERICQFGLAHVDTPRGDLDASGGELDGPTETVAVFSEMYPFGTTEQFPDTDDNSAHNYMECSNKGMCDRSAGTCECFPGYEGSACQRASCPSSGGSTCSGHGTCETIKQISARDASNIYELWDEESTLGCVCDAGYYGADCALRECKYGADPLYFDDNANIRFSTWTVELSRTTASSGVLQGEYALIFYDHFGENWQSGPIAHDASCDEIITALEDIPNDVIPDDSVRCRMFTSAAWGLPTYATSPTLAKTVLYKYQLSFRENPGLLKEIEVNRYLDGKRPTLFTTETTSTLQAFIYADGIHGEDVDFVPDECEDVIVHFGTVEFPGDNGVGVVDLTALVFGDEDSTNPIGDKQLMLPLLKRCLGHSDNDFSFDSSANEVYNWDYGTMQNPHLVKFVREGSETTTLCKSGEVSCTDSTPPGFYAPIIYTTDSSGDEHFAVYSRAASLYSSAVNFRVFTTTGYLNRVAYDADVYTTTAAADWKQDHPNFVYTGKTTHPSLLTNDPASGSYAGYVAHAGSTGEIDCETRDPTGAMDRTTGDCIKKNDWLMFFSVDHSANNIAVNPERHNIYQVEKIYKEDYSSTNGAYRNRIVLNMHTNLYSPKQSSVAAVITDARPIAYKFYPPTREVRYVDQCSGRGICNSAEGLCECFVGYTNDDCSIQSSGAV